MAKGEEIGPALKEVGEGVRTVSGVVDVACGTCVGVVGKGAEVGGSLSAGDSAGVKFAEHHSGGLDETDGGV
jgi:hypothetical protein